MGSERGCRGSRRSRGGQREQALAAPARRRGGRPRTWGTAEEDQILAKIRLGCSDRQACACVKPNPIDLNAFRERVKDDHGFALRVKAARGSGNAELAEVIRKGALGTEKGKPDWTNARLQAALCILRAHEPETYAEKTRLEHSGQVGFFEAAAAATLRDRDKPEDNG